MTPGDLFARYDVRDNRILAPITVEPSSLSADNQMVAFRFSSMKNEDDKQIFKLTIDNNEFRNIVIDKLFNNNSIAYETYMSKAKIGLMNIRAIFECHFVFRHYDPCIDEVTRFQPLFYCLLHGLLELLPTNSNSLSPPSTQLVVQGANRYLLSFEANLCSDDDNDTNVIVETINGYSDLMVSVMDSSDDRFAVCLN